MLRRFGVQSSTPLTCGCYVAIALNTNSFEPITHPASLQWSGIKHVERNDRPTTISVLTDAPSVHQEIPETSPNITRNKVDTEFTICKDESTNTLYRVISLRHTSSVKWTYCTSNQTTVPLRSCRPIVLRLEYHDTK
jgi:hypothetical protein